MSIGGNCADIGFLGKNRVRGPLDNVICANGCLTWLDILNGSYIKILKNKPLSIQNRKPSFDGDSDKLYVYSNVWICHHNPLTKHYIDNLSDRIEVFANFYEKVCNDKKYYFTYCINEFDMEKKTHSVKHTNNYYNYEYNGDTFENGIKKLKEIGILDKIIFVGTRLDKSNATWDYYLNNIDYYIKTYGIKYVEIIDNNIWHPNKSHKQFLEKVNKLLD